jgi:hypothetical protein
MSKEIVMWDKPKRKISKEEWKNISADSAPPGVYTPNMSDEDRCRWKGKIVGQKIGHPQAELRKSFHGAQMLIIVSVKGGYKYKNYTREETNEFNVHMSLNGGAQMNFHKLKNI